MAERCESKEPEGSKGQGQAKLGLVSAKYSADAIKKTHLLHIHRVKNWIKSKL